MKAYKILYKLHVNKCFESLSFAEVWAVKLHPKYFTASYFGSSHKFLYIFTNRYSKALLFVYAEFC